jgi:hypothetical protein
LIKLNPNYEKIKERTKSWELSGQGKVKAFRETDFVSESGFFGVLQIGPSIGRKNEACDPGSARAFGSSIGALGVLSDQDGGVSHFTELGGLGLEVALHTESLAVVVNTSREGKTTFGGPLQGSSGYGGCSSQERGRKGEEDGCGSRVQHDVCVFVFVKRGCD